MKSYQKDTESSQQRKKNVDRAKESHPQKKPMKLKPFKATKLSISKEKFTRERLLKLKEQAQPLRNKKQESNTKQITQVVAPTKPSSSKAPLVSRDSFTNEHLEIFDLTRLGPPPSSTAVQPPKRKIEEITGSETTASSMEQSTAPLLASRPFIRKLFKTSLQDDKLRLPAVSSFSNDAITESPTDDKGSSSAKSSAKKQRVSQSSEDTSSLHTSLTHISNASSKSATDDPLGLRSVSAAFAPGAYAPTPAPTSAARSSAVSATVTPAPLSHSPAVSASDASASAVRSSVASSSLASTTTISDSVVAKATDTSARKISRRLVHVFPSRSVHSETQTDGPPYSIDRAIAFIRHINGLPLHTTIDDIMTDGCFEDILVPRNTQLNERTVGELTQDPNPEWSRDPDLFYQISSQTEYNDLMHDYFNGHHPFKKDEVFKQPSSSRK
ncbi:hypothetical protein CU097_010961 [Rhizopus azygosporus]|uniref:Uncharacterized protein n=1 Tax=Rhizopus azygosporus TaxID=86630 RepID=A0A367K651_RHIAZ|nr:hypothetical protein CU097_010961 [Rhizopus azygosporus]CEI85582.1 hypothetical protein RMCBS344292_00042 [Rhizopus microsporus]